MAFPGVRGVRGKWLVQIAPHVGVRAVAEELCEVRVELLEWRLR